MWTAKILNEIRQNGALLVKVQYTDGNETISDSIDLTGGTLDKLNNIIAGRLAGLEVTSALVVPVGPFTPTAIVETEISADEKLRRAVQVLQAKKAAVELGLIPQKELDDATVAVQADLMP